MTCLVNPPKICNKYKIQTTKQYLLLPFCTLVFPRDYAKGSNTATPRGAWLRLVKDAAGVSDMKEAILMLEETLRGLQEGEDKMEGGRMGEVENRPPSVACVGGGSV